jgi:hypothetical protein
VSERSERTNSTVPLAHRTSPQMVDVADESMVQQ